MENKPVSFDNSTSAQIGVVIIPSTNGGRISEYNPEPSRKSGVGTAKNNRVVWLIAKDDRNSILLQGMVWKASFLTEHLN